MAGYLFRFLEAGTRKDTGIKMQYDDSLVSSDLASYLQKKHNIQTGSYIAEVIEPNGDQVKVQPIPVEIKEKGEKKNKKTKAQEMRDRLTDVKMQRLEDMQEDYAMKQMEKELKSLEKKLEQDEENFSDEDNERLEELYEKLEDLESSFDRNKYNPIPQQQPAFNIAEFMMLSQQENTRLERERLREERQREKERQERQDEKERERLERQERIERENQRYREEAEERRMRYDQQIQQQQMQFQASLHQNKSNPGETIAAVIAAVTPLVTPILQKISEAPKDPLGEATARIIPELVTATSKAQIETQGKMLTSYVELLKNPPQTMSDQIEQMKAYSQIAAEVAPVLGDTVGKIMAARSQTPQHQSSQQHNRGEHQEHQEPQLTPEEKEQQEFQQRLSVEMAKVANELHKNIEKDIDDLEALARSASPWACEVAKDRIQPPYKSMVARRMAYEICNEKGITDSDQMNKVHGVITRIIMGNEGQ
jgi:hypothetical protein